MTGRPVLLTPDQAVQALALVESGSSVTKVAELLGVSRSTVRRSMARVLPSEPEPVEGPAVAKPAWPPPARPDEEWHLVPVDDGTGRMVPVPVRWVRLFSNLGNRVEVGVDGPDIYCSGCAAFLPFAEIMRPGNTHRVFPRPMVGSLLPMGDDDPDAA